MSETNELKEGGESKHFDINNHQEFVKSRFDRLKQKTGTVLGSSLVGGGSILALTGIADFFTGNNISEFLKNVSPSSSPQIVSWAAHHLADMPLIIKTGGGSSMIATGKILIDKSSE